MDRYLKVKYSQTLYGIVSKIYEGKPENDEDALASRILYSSSPTPNALPSSSKPICVKIRRFFQCPKEIFQPIPLQCSCFGSFLRGPVPRLQAIWGEHPAGHPEELQGCRARPSQARAAATMGLWGPEAGSCSLSARR